MKIKVFQFNPFPVNTIVIYDIDSLEAIIIDPGMLYEKEKKELSDFITNKQLKVRCLLNTHLHLDHCFGNNYILQTYGLRTLAHQEEELNRQSMPQMAQRFGIKLTEPLPEIERYLHENEVINVGKIELKVLHVPGHSPGSVAFYEKNKAILISGDVIFQGSIGRTDLGGGNLEVLVKGIQKKLLTLPENTAVIPGHGPTTTIGIEKATNYYLK